MIQSPIRTRTATAIAILALFALLATPIFFNRQIERERSAITTSFEPAREASARASLALSREFGALRGFLLIADRDLLSEYRAARRSRDSALAQLSSLTGLGDSLQAKVQRIAESARQWNALNDSVILSVSPASALSALRPAQQASYRAALSDIESFDRAISAEVIAGRRRIGSGGRMWTIASVALAVLAAAAAAIVLIMSRSALRQTELARTDPLTGLYNRRGFSELAQRELSRAQRYKFPLTLLTFDVDGFKAVNDRLGHAAGDQLLVAVAAGIREAIRQIDVGGRLGGDEFVVLLPDNKGKPPEMIVERIRAMIMKRLEQGKWPVTLSVGAVTIQDSTLDIDAILRETDGLMYQVKAAGKNSVMHRSLPPGNDAP